MFSNIGTVEIIIIAIVLLVLFGGKKLPELAKGLGQASKEFRSAFADDEEEKKEQKKDN